mmetsp:Transcript_11650/g.17682  ORF Transcript_11650/g.17682 Transcript_11650/m.17682 type:complete len:161 (+) Transcript_11650:340-822(+)
MHLRNHVVIKESSSDNNIDHDSDDHETMEYPGDIARPRKDNNGCHNANKVEEHIHGIILNIIIVIVNHPLTFLLRPLPQIRPKDHTHTVPHVRVEAGIIFTSGLARLPTYLSGHINTVQQLPSTVQHKPDHILDEHESEDTHRKRNFITSRPKATPIHLM